MTEPTPTAPLSQAEVDTFNGAVVDGGAPAALSAADVPEPTHVTTCGVCGQTDNHPKHFFTLNAQSGEGTERHMDCCAPLGCPLCATARKDAGDKTGREFQLHLHGVTA